MTKALLQIAVPVDTLHAARERSATLNVSLTDFVDFALSGACSIPEERAKQWAEKHQRVVGRTLSPTTLRLSERRVLETMERLAAAGPLAPRVFTLRDVVNASGLLTREAFSALLALRRLGHVQSIDNGEVDKWGRPGLSLWWAAKTPPHEHVKTLDVELFSRLALFRAHFANGCFGPLGHHWVIAALQRGLGLSPDAHGVPGLPSTPATHPENAIVYASSDQARAWALRVAPELFKGVLS